MSCHCFFDWLINSDVDGENVVAANNGRSRNCRKEGKTPAETEAQECFKMLLGKCFGDLKCQVHCSQQTVNFSNFLQADTWLLVVGML